MSEQLFERWSSGFATASLVAGVLGLMVVWIPVIGMVAWVLSPLGLLLGLVSVANPISRGVAIAGIVCSAVGLVCRFAWAPLFGATVQLGGLL